MSYKHNNSMCVLYGIYSRQAPVHHTHKVLMFLYNLARQRENDDDEL